MRVRVMAPTRLHFGLLHVPAAKATADLAPFGGLGLMLDEPFVSVIIEPAATMEVAGSLASRASQFLTQLAAPPMKVQADGPPEHVGLGVGTALGLSLAKAVATIQGETETPVTELALRSGRGARSRIGLTGFEFGGFIVDHGHGEEDPEPFRFPTAWRVLLLRPAVEPRWHGEIERKAFQSTRSAEDVRSTTAKLTKLINSYLLHSLIAHDFGTFAASLGDYNRIAGEPFRTAQRGEFSHPRIAETIQWLRGTGHPGAGQSSWGPTVFCICESEADAISLKSDLSKRLPDVSIVGITGAASVGAIVETD